MEVYYSTDETIWGHSKQAEQLTKFSINRTVLWEEQEIFIPAVYVGVSGAMLDLCVKIPSGDMIRFLKKWENPAESASLKTRKNTNSLNQKTQAASILTQNCA